MLDVLKQSLDTPARKPEDAAFAGLQVAFLPFTSPSFLCHGADYRQCRTALNFLDYCSFDHRQDGQRTANLLVAHPIPAKRGHNRTSHSSGIREAQARSYRREPFDAP